MKIENDPYDQTPLTTREYHGCPHTKRHQDLHPCPYEEETKLNFDFRCRCCLDCEAECGAQI